MVLGGKKKEPVRKIAKKGLTTLKNGSRITPVKARASLSDPLEGALSP